MKIYHIYVASCLVRSEDANSLQMTTALTSGKFELFHTISMNSIFIGTSAFTVLYKFLNQHLRPTHTICCLHGNFANLENYSPAIKRASSLFSQRAFKLHFFQFLTIYTEFSVCWNDLHTATLWIIIFKLAADESALFVISQ